MFDIPRQGEILSEAKPIKEKKPKAEKARRVCDPRLVTAARELRDRWLEQVNAGEAKLLSAGRYEVCRVMAGEPADELVRKQYPALPAA
jgi:hypothetical protein